MGVLSHTLELVTSHKHTCHWDIIMLYSMSQDTSQQHTQMLWLSARGYFILVSIHILLCEAIVNLCMCMLNYNFKQRCVEYVTSCSWSHISGFPNSNYQQLQTTGQYYHIVPIALRNLQTSMAYLCQWLKNNYNVTCYKKRDHLRILCFSF